MWACELGNSGLLTGMWNPWVPGLPEGVNLVSLYFFSVRVIQMEEVFFGQELDKCHLNRV